MPKVKRKWQPHDKQKEILNADERFRVVAAGRRFGKTKMACSELFERGYQNPDAFLCYFGPTDDDARELAFEPLVEWIPDSLLAGEPKKTPPREIELFNGARLQFRGTKSSSRGRGWDFVIIDEASDVRADFWPAVLRPALSDTLGEALFIGTPKGRNWFWESFNRGEDPSYPDWTAFQATTYSNPHVPDSEIDAAKKNLPERIFRQEYLAEFVDNEGAVFGDVRNRNVRPYDIAKTKGKPPYSTGVDLARSSNYLVAVTIDADGMVVDMLRQQGGSWAAAGRTMENYLTHFPGVCYLDATRDNKVIEDLSRSVRNCQIEPVRFTPNNKADMIENLAARLETKDIILPKPDNSEEIATLLAELDAFQYETTPSGNVRYCAPEGKHDDTVDAFALAAKEKRQARATW